MLCNGKRVTIETMMELAHERANNTVSAIEARNRTKAFIIIWNSVNRLKEEGEKHAYTSTNSLKQVQEREHKL